MYTHISKNESRSKRRVRIQARIRGSHNIPRLSVFRSSRYIYAQLIDDDKQETLLFLSDSLPDTQKIKLEESELKDTMQTPRIVKAYQLGKLLALKAQSLKISKIVFDRAGYQYHGRVKAIAEGARAGGLVF